MTRNLLHCLLPTRTALPAVLGTCLLAGALSAPAQEEEQPSPPPLPEKVDTLLRSMSGHLAKATAFSAVAELTIDEILDSGLMIQRTGTLRLQARRPDGLRAHLKTDTEERTIWFDGETVTIVDLDDGVHSQVKIPGTLDTVLDRLMTRYGISIALTDFLYEDPYAVLTSGIDVARYIGLSEVDGKPCHHLAFGQEAIDWQLWIESGDRPVPRKLMVVYKDEPGAPRYAVRLVESQLEAELPENAFTPVIPETSSRIDLFDRTAQNAPEAPASDEEPQND